ncbi:hypothetical protein CLV62_11130 [Dysgonomonas alginatilytica]|uniref:DNA-binding beta-propeller fold protein YncE n=1 Tax=Dysgonomonas alginatilytica TaxID=1605892 RepID=A0A2V3PR87_9BACT|nr:hypothetical protein [Dysgonomonas alginatilytica]PXV64073.1 hypothetical protein CLV62_11130 [Dysgonomonas alginatilytica]
MKKKNLLWSMLLFGATLIGFSSCSDNDSDNNQDTSAVELPGAYILNSGKMGSNGSVLSYYGFKSAKISNQFEKANGIMVGDVGQDAIVYGSKTYVAVYNSGLIYVLDINGKIVSTIKSDATRPSEKLQPRALESYNGKVYVTLFDGYLARIDTTTLTIDKSIAVGPNPEAVKVVNNKVYVANSGGFVADYQFNNTVSVVDPELSTKKDIIVAINPNELKVDKYNNLYLVSLGNYGLTKPIIPNILQQINTTTDAVTKLDEGRSFSIFPEGDRLYMLKKEYDASYTPSSSFTYYDIVNKKVVEESFITDGTTIKDISLIKSEPTTGDMYVLGANGQNNGDMYIFSSAGKLKSKLDTGGAFPVKIWFVK